MSYRIDIGTIPASVVDANGNTVPNAKITIEANPIPSKGPPYFVGDHTGTVEIGYDTFYDVPIFASAPIPSGC